MVKWVQIGLAIVLIVCVLALVLEANSQGIELRTVGTSSMSPALNIGDVVVISREEASEINVEDIITFKIGDSYVTHRVVAVVPEGYRTKGDSGPELDADIVTQQKIIGKVIFVLPYLGYAGNVVKSPLVIAILILIPVLIIIIMELRKPKKDHRREEIPALEYKGNLLEAPKEHHQHKKEE